MTLTQTEHHQPVAGTFSLDNYKSAPLPNPLWHIRHQQSQSKRDPDTGDIIAADSDSIILDETILEGAASKHFDWGNREPTCFVSAFSNLGHAESWGNQRAGEVSISTIDTAKLPAGTRVFEARFVADKLGIRHKWSKDEFIFLHRIPHESIMRRQILKHVETKVTGGGTVTEKTEGPEAPEVTEVTQVAKGTEETGEMEETKETEVVEVVEVAEEAGTCAATDNNGTSSPHGQTDLVQSFHRLKVDDTIQSTATVIKFR